MKKLLVTLTLALAFVVVNAQTLTYENKKIHYGDLTVSIIKAKNMALEQNYVQAFEAFSKAGKKRGWNYVWSFLGGWELAGGLITAAYGNSIGFVDMGIGAGLLVMVRNREQQREMYIKKGVEYYNNRQ